MKSLQLVDLQDYYQIHLQIFFCNHAKATTTHRFKSIPRESLTMIRTGYFRTRYLTILPRTEAITTNEDLPESKN